MSFNPLKQRDYKFVLAKIIISVLLVLKTI